MDSSSESLAIALKAEEAAEEGWKSSSACESSALAVNASDANDAVPAEELDASLRAGESNSSPIVCV